MTAFSMYLAVINSSDTARSLAKEKTGLRTQQRPANDCDDRIVHLECLMKISAACLLFRPPKLGRKLYERFRIRLRFEEVAPVFA
jgi:hypothetical protein